MGFRPTVSLAQGDQPYKAKDKDSPNPSIFVSPLILLTQPPFPIFLHQAAVSPVLDAAPSLGLALLPLPLPGRRYQRRHHHRHHPCRVHTPLGAVAPLRRRPPYRSCRRRRFADRCIRPAPPVLAPVQAPVPVPPAGLASGHWRHLLQPCARAPGAAGLARPCCACRQPTGLSPLTSQSSYALGLAWEVGCAHAPPVAGTTLAQFGPRGRRHWWI